MPEETRIKKNSALEDAAGARADYWSGRMASGPLTSNEARDFNQWIAADPAHERAFQAAQALRKELTHIRDLDEYRDWLTPSPYERIAKSVNACQENLAVRIKHPYAILGAGFAAAMLAVFAAVLISTEGTPSKPAILPSVVTNVAEVRDLTLSDGSVVTVGAASSVTEAFTARERRVILSAGEAFFDVEKDAERPFIVVAGDTLVRVRGTKFDVSLGSDAVNIAVSEGRVEVIQPEGAPDAIRDRDIKHILLAGQRAVTSSDGRVQPVRQIKAEDVASWRRGELAWADTPIKDIIADLNRYSTREIELRAGRVADLEYTLAVRADDIPGAVNLIAASLGLEIEEADRGKLILR